MAFPTRHHEQTPRLKGIGGSMVIKICSVVRDSQEIRQDSPGQRRAKGIEPRTVFERSIRSSDVRIIKQFRRLLPSAQPFIVALLAESLVVHEIGIVTLADFAGLTT